MRGLTLGLCLALLTLNACGTSLEQTPRPNQIQMSGLVVTDNPYTRPWNNGTLASPFTASGGPGSAVAASGISAAR